ncbi:MAG: hypothetical protein V1790_10490 [Planctomycetota bacterium]
MQRPIRWTIGLTCLAGLVALGSMLVGFVSCGTAPTPFLVQGPSQLGNVPSTMTIAEPIANITRGQGDPFLIKWTDADPDSAAKIRFSLVNTQTNSVIVLVDGIEEDDQVGPDNETVATSLIPVGTYNLLGTIADEKTSVEVFAMTTGTTPARVIVTIVAAGGGPQTVPPILTVTAPAFNLSVAQDDQVEVRVQPSALAPVTTIPFDPDSDITLYLVLDLDLDPNNDDPANPDPSQIIVLDRKPVAIGGFQVDPFMERIDLAVVPPRPNGDPYYIRVTADDGTNPRVHQYAVGTLNVVQLAAGIVDLADIGRKVSGATLFGFNPGANLGSSVASVQDFDNDGLDDFVVVAQFGNPQNVGPVGEAYLLYGRDDIRLGGMISVNSIGNTINGVVFQAPPIRRPFAADAFPRTEGIADVSFIRDLTGDGRPELIFGLPHVHGAYDSTDYDPGDSPPQDIDPVGCYPDPYVNNISTQGGPDVQFYAGGMAVMVNSSNRDVEGVNINLNRLESTAITLELVGQLPLRLGTSGLDPSGGIITRASNGPTPAEQLGNDPQEAGRIAGVRFIAGGYDFVGQFLTGPVPPREDEFGSSVGSLGDLNSDGLDEIILSAPRNERYLSDLQTSTPAGSFNSHLESTSFHGSIVILPGDNYNLTLWRDMSDDSGTSLIPLLDHHIVGPFGGCTSPRVSRSYFIPAEAAEIFAEDIDDMLGGGRSAGDFNQDWLDDILCGAPLNDRRSTLRDSGAVYIIYGRTTFGQIELKKANDPLLRPPMLRVRGVSPGDQIGWRQTSGLDVNGDRVDDIFISSPRTDFGDVTRSTCGGDFNRDGIIDANDLHEVSFHDCLVSVGDEVFSDDPCKVFDYDNDGDIDADDRCVFCCLSGECEPDGMCVSGRSANCCENMVDNGFVGIIFGGRFTDGDRDITQIAASDLPGTVFYGGHAGDRAGMDVSSAGDFNQDGFGDILIAAPGEVRRDSAGRQRVGVVYLIFGGTHLQNTTWNLSDPERGVGSPELPGVVFLSPFVKARPNEAAPTTVGFIGDINHDGFGDILIGNPKADFIDLSFPQGPDAPGSDPAAGRRSNAGNAYIVYGNNFGSNRASP